MSEPERSRIAVLIDADNIGASYAREIFSAVCRFGEPIVRRAYGTPQCFQSEGGWQLAQREYGIVSKPQVSNVKGKNVADIALVIDAMECLYTLPCDGICIVSNDSDYTALAAKIREAGKQVYGIGNAKAPISFRSACTKYVVLKKPAKPVPAPAPVEPRCPRCGAKLVKGWTKSRRVCLSCEACGGMSAKVGLLRQTFDDASVAEISAQARVHAVAGCTCPDCGNSMSLIKVGVGKREIEIDVCGKCQSVWYDKDEFESIVPSDGRLSATASAGKAFRREVATMLAADLRAGRVRPKNLGALKGVLKGVYHVPAADIEAIVGTLQCQKVVQNGKTGLNVLQAEKEAAK